MPPPENSIGSIFQVVKGAQSPIYSTASSLFSTIVAVMKAKVGRRLSLFIEFREFQQCETRNFGSGSKIHIRRRRFRVIMAVSCHLDGLLAGEERSGMEKMQELSLADSLAGAPQRDK